MSKQVSIHDHLGRRIGRTSLKRAQGYAADGRGEFRTFGHFQFYGGKDTYVGEVEYRASRLREPAELAAPVSRWSPAYGMDRAVLQPWPPGGYERLCLSRGM